MKKLALFVLVAVMVMTVFTPAHGQSLDKGKPQPYGTLSLVDANMPIVAGDAVWLTAEFYSSEPAQFIIGAIKSTCPTQGLPTGSVSSPGSTYVKFSYYINIGPMEKPGVCKLSVTFWIWGHRDVVYTATGKYQVSSQP